MLILCFIRALKHHKEALKYPKGLLKLKIMLSQQLLEVQDIINHGLTLVTWAKLEEEDS